MDAQAPLTPNLRKITYAIGAVFVLLGILDAADGQSLKGLAAVALGVGLGFSALPSVRARPGRVWLASGLALAGALTSLLLALRRLA